MRKILICVCILWAALARAACDPTVARSTPKTFTGLRELIYLRCHWEEDYNELVNFIENDYSVGSFTMVNVDATAYDDYEIWISPGETLIDVTAYYQGTCTTPPTFSFTDRSGQAIDLVSTLTAVTGTGNSTRVAFDTNDNDRILTDGEGLRIFVDNAASCTKVMVQWRGR